MNSLEQLSKTKLAILDDKFIEYQSVDRDISRRKFELTYPWTPSVEHVGGRSAGITKPQERLYEMFDSDIRLTYLYRLKAECERAIERFDDEQLEIYQLRYTTDNYHGWDEVGDLLHYGHTTIYRKRYALLNILAKESGLI